MHLACFSIRWRMLIFDPDWGSSVLRFQLLYFLCFICYQCVVIKCPLRHLFPDAFNAGSIPKLAFRCEIMLLLIFLRRDGVILSSQNTQGRKKQKCCFVFFCCCCSCFFFTQSLVSGTLVKKQELSVDVPLCLSLITTAELEVMTLGFSRGGSG